MGILNSPLDFANHLQLRPTPTQIEALNKVYHEGTEVDLVDVPEDKIIRVAAVSALWGMLAVQGARCTVIASDEYFKRQFLDFMRIMTYQNEALREACRWNKHHHLRIRGEDQRELRLVPNNSACIRGIRNNFVVILGAGGSDPEFCEARECLEHVAKRHNANILRVW